jgi:hypothetical protein
VISKRTVRITDEAEAAVRASGLSLAEQGRLLRRLLDHLTGPGADGLRLKRVPEDPECFAWVGIIATPDTWHVFTFHVNDTMLANVFIVESAAHATRAPKSR